MPGDDRGRHTHAVLQLEAKVLRWIDVVLSADLLQAIKY